MIKIVGYSLIEFMMTISIMIILLSMSTSFMNDYVHANRLQIYEHELLQLLMYAEQESISRHALVSFCHGDTEDNCNNPKSSMIIILDRTRHEILAKHRLTFDVGGFHWRRYPIYRKDLAFTPNGLHQVDNASLWYCEKNEVQFALIMNQFGRIRTIEFNQFNQSKEEFPCH